MKIELNLKDCEKCGIYLNIDKVEKHLLTLKKKSLFKNSENYYIHIYGFYCPLCKQLHIKRDFDNYDIREAIKLDEDCDDSLREEEYLKMKLNITDRYYEFKYYGENDE